MWDFIRRWHPLIILVIGIYLAVPKPAPNPAEIDREFLELHDSNGDGVLDSSEFEGSDIDFELRDRNSDGVLTVGSRFRWPLHEYKMNLGQDLKGGSSLRYVLVQQDLIESEKQIREMLKPLEDNLDRLSPEALAKFGEAIEGGELVANMWSSEDFGLIANIPGVYDEGRADALRKYYQTWNAAKQRKDDADLVGPTIETLNRRLNSTGITELNIAPLGDNRLEVKLPEFASVAETDRYKQLLQTTGKLQMRVLAAEDSEFLNLEVGEYPREEGYKYKWLELDREDATGSQLVKERGGRRFVPVQVIDEYEITGQALDNIQPTTDQQGGIAVSFDLKGLAVARFENLTRLHREHGQDPRLLAIVIDDKIYSAYSIRDTISGSVQLSGRFTAQERDDLINVLKSGSLNVKLELEGEESVGPSEGAEAVRRGLFSLLIGALGVFLISLIVYRGLGFLTIFNLIMVVVLVLGAMAAGLGTLTMPGIAGLVLTIGMAIDANILINERIREERERNQNTRGAVEEGFRNAMSAIVDGNVTTLLTALILFKVGSGPIQGFALTLAIGIVATLYTSLAAYRVMVTGILNVKRDARLGMAGLNFVRNRKINWLRWMAPGAIAAGVLIIVGSSFIATHGAEILGIEFRGGHTFRIQMKEGYDREEIADMVMDESTGEAKFDWASDIEIQPVFRFGGNLEGGKADRFDFRFPMKSEWANEEPEQITRMLRAHLEEVFAEQMVEEGWQARPVGVQETTLQVRMDLQLKNPTEFRETYPDSWDRLWFSRDRAWGQDVNAPSVKRDQWFSGIGAQEVIWDMRPSASGDRQTYELRLTGVAVSGDQDLDTKRRQFRDAVHKNIIDDSQHVDVIGEPAFESFPTRANLHVNVVFLEPVSVEDFTVNAILSEVGDAERATLRSAGLAVTALDAEGGMTNRFEITTSGFITFSPDPEDSEHFSRISGALNEAVIKWVADAEPPGNEVSTRFLLSSAIGATVAAESQWRALFAIIAALIVVVIYIRIRFASVAWGMAAVVALLHDSFVVVGLIGLVDYFGADIKIDLTVVAAILTVIGYSLNDTIINFDRIRENLKNDRLATGGKTPLKEIINASINQMLPRTFMTSGTTLVTTITMLAIGGPLLKGFAFAMTCGIIVGTFSSIYIAGPILLLFSRVKEGGLLDLTEEEKEEEEQAKVEIAAAGEQEQAKGDDQTPADEKEARDGSKDEDKKD